MNDDIETTMFKIREAVARQFVGELINGQHLNAAMKLLLKELQHDRTV